MRRNWTPCRRLCAVVGVGHHCGWVVWTLSHGACASTDCAIARQGLHRAVGALHLALYEDANALWGSPGLRRLDQIGGIDECLVNGIVALEELIRVWVE